MRRKNIIQLLQFIAIWVFIWLFVIFVNKQSFLDFILKYRFYLLIVSVSYFYYYSIEYEPDKKYQLIRSIILYWNVYLFAHIFFRPLLNISHELFFLLWLIVLWIWGTTKMNSKWKYLLQVIWWIFSFFILISWIFYLYPDGPDIEWFIKWRNYEIFALWVSESIDRSDAYVQIVDGKRSNAYDITPFFLQILSENCKISYPSLRSQRDEKLVIMSPYWEVVQLFPQSEIQLQFSWGNSVKLLKITWKILSLSWAFTWRIEVIWWEVVNEQEQAWLEWVQDMYKYDLVDYLKDQISESNIGWANNTIMYNIDGEIINFLVKLFPATFSRNLRNYNEFQEYFSWVDSDEINLSRYSLEEDVWWVKLFWENLKKWMRSGKTNMYKIFKKH